MSNETRYKNRFILLVAAVGIVSLVIMTRLVVLQVLDADAYRQRARDQHEGRIRVEGRRGTIWERNGRELAVSIETKSVYVHPALIASAGERDRIATSLASVLHTPASEIRALIDRAAGRKFVFLRRRLSPSQALAIQQLHLPPAVGLMNDTRRIYPRGTLAAHALGFVDVDGKGQAGIERAYDDTVRGKPATFLSLLDARQRPLLLRTTAPGRPGRDLVLTLDETIQHLADTELDRAMEETRAKAGSVIVMDPRSGEILALANRPDFDPNAPAGPGKNRENIAVSYGYEPGSTFKLITAAAAVEENRVRPGDLFDCGHGSITLYGRRIGDHRPFGTLSLTQIISQSSNVGIIRVGQRIPEHTFCDYVERFGFGRRTGVKLPNEAPGVVQTPGSRNWSGLSQAMMSMGQSIVVTPLQMLVAVSALATGGERQVPKIIRSLTATDGSSEPQPSFASVRVVSRETAAALTRMMEEVVLDGTGTAAAIPGYRVAGKTGTAQKVVNGVYSHSAHVSSFVGFAPSRDPALAAIVVLDEPVGKYHGGDIAAPTFARVLGPALAYMRVAPTEPFTPAPRNEILRARAERAERASLRRRSAADGSADAAPRPFPATWPLTVAAVKGTVPDLYGCNLRDALATLIRSGCAVRTSGSGFVVDQFPVPGSALAPGEVCTLVLASERPESDQAGAGL